MKLHCTDALARKLSPQAVESAPESAWASWHGHLLRFDRRQCVMFCHDQTRYVMLLPGLRAKQFAELERWHRDLFAACLGAQGIRDDAIVSALSALGPTTWDRHTDRSVLSSMRVAAQDFELGILEELPHILAMDPVRVSCELNRRPATIRGEWMWPGEDMRKLVEALSCP
jgi:hypothetical protein